MKNIIVFFTLLLLPGCSEMFYSGSSNSQMISEMNAKIEANVKSAMGAPKQLMVMNWGPPTSISSDGTEKGEVYSYVKSLQFSFGLYTSYVYLYFNENGIVYYTNFKYTLE